jgi:hypothetical protein
MVQCRWPESLASDFVGELVDRSAELLESSPSFIECSFAAMFGFIPGGHAEVVEEVGIWLGGKMQLWYVEMRECGDIECLHIKIYTSLTSHASRKASLRSSATYGLRCVAGRLRGVALHLDDEAGHE